LRVQPSCRAGELRVANEFPARSGSGTNLSRCSSPWLLHTGLGNATGPGGRAGPRERAVGPSGPGKCAQVSRVVLQATESAKPRQHSRTLRRRSALGCPQVGEVKLISKRRRREGLKCQVPRTEATNAKDGKRQETPRTYRAEDRKRRGQQQQAARRAHMVSAERRNAWQTPSSMAQRAPNGTAQHNEGGAEWQAAWQAPTRSGTTSAERNDTRNGAAW
jgi:hypothetical protein